MAQSSWVPQAGNAFLPQPEVILGPMVSPLGPCLGGAARSAGRRGPGAPFTAALVGLMPSWASRIAASQRHSASCLRGLKHQSRKLHNGPGRPPPRWLMGGAVRCRGLAFDLRVSSCALPMRPRRACGCVCACTRVSVCVHACEQTMGCGPGSQQEEGGLDPIRVCSCSDIRIFTLTWEDAQMAACVWG